MNGRFLVVRFSFSTPGSVFNPGRSDVTGVIRRISFLFCNVGLFHDLVDRKDEQEMW